MENEVIHKIDTHSIDGVVLGDSTNVETANATYTFTNGKSDDTSIEKTGPTMAELERDRVYHTSVIIESLIDDIFEIVMGGKSKYKMWKTHDIIGADLHIVYLKDVHTDKPVIALNEVFENIDNDDNEYKIIHLSVFIDVIETQYITYLGLDTVRSSIFFMLSEALSNAIAENKKLDSDDSDE